MKVKAAQAIKLEIHAAWFTFFLQNSMLCFIPLRFIQANPNPIVIVSDHRMHDKPEVSQKLTVTSQGHVSTTFMATFAPLVEVKNVTCLPA